MEEYSAARFIEENMKTIFAYALARVSNKEDAEDLASEIIIAILQSEGKIKDENAFYGFVWGIAANTYKSFLRKRKKHACSELDETIPCTDGTLDAICAKEEINALRRELSLLSKEYRECTVAYYIDGLSCAETAEREGISLEMVKYYLFKTRKILKEGIGMEREYGEKSYNPARFELVTVFSGNYNAEYRNLFNRKLPGNIMLSTYYTPMTVRELSLELGVATPYLEDEIGLLEKYDLIRSLRGGKYQTNLVVFTEGFTKEFYKTAEAECTAMLEKTLTSAKEKLDEVRKNGFIGASLEDDRLLWAFLWMLMRAGHNRFEENNPDYKERSTLYNGATGINYGVDYDENAIESKYDCNAFAGYAGVDGDYAVAFADFGVLPEKNRLRLRISEYGEQIREAVKDPEKATLAVFTDEDIKGAESIFEQEIKDFADIYAYLKDTAVNVMNTHAPEHVKDQVRHVVGSTIFFRTAGLIGACAAETKVLNIPQCENTVAIYAYKTNKNVFTGDVM